jgi:hypothetical protein
MKKRQLKLPLSANKKKLVLNMEKLARLSRKNSIFFDVIKIYIIFALEFVKN